MRRWHLGFQTSLLEICSNPLRAEQASSFLMRARVSLLQNVIDLIKSMCGGSEQSNSNSSTTEEAAVKTSNNMKDLNELSAETCNSFSSLLEYAANNDIEAFKRSIELDLCGVDEAGLWYVRKIGSKQITQEERTPLMVAATYGSVDVLKLIVALPEVDLNRSCGHDKWTALHCAAFGGSINAFDVVKLLLSAGADPNIMDANGRRPTDVIVVTPKLPNGKAAIEDLLMNNISDGLVGECNLPVSISSSNVSSPILSSSPESRSPFSPSYFVSSPTAPKLGGNAAVNSVSEKKQYPVDPSLPDIRNSIYSTDEFRMFSFKVRPCSRAYSHDWTECPFVHPGENARRRDPRKFHYSCVPCPDFRKGACRRGDMCEYAHGVFECWLHPAQYRTRLCKDGTSCARQVCFFAHTQEELRPLYVSTGSGLPSPRSAGFMDMASALSIFPGSPTSQSVMSSSAAFNQTMSMSPTANGMSHSSPAWPQPNVPTLHLPGSNFQSSRLRSSLNARDIPPGDLNMLRDYGVLNDLACFSQARPNSAMLGGGGSVNRPNTTLTPSNLEELFSAEIALSPRFSDQAAAAAFGAFSPSHKSAVLNHLQQQQSILSPVNTNVFSPRNMEHPLLQGSFVVSSPRSLELGSPMSARLSTIAQRERQQLQMRSLSSRDLGSHRTPIVGVGSLNTAWSNKWGSPNGKADWSVSGDGQGPLNRSSSFEPKNDGDEPDLSWVQSLVKESPPEMTDKPAAPVPSGECLNNTNSSQNDSVDHSVLGAWLEQMRLDQLVV